MHVDPASGAALWRCPSRRLFLNLLLTAPLLAAMPAAAARMPRLAILRTQPRYAIEIETALKQRLAELGYLAGKTIDYLPTLVVKSSVQDFAETASLVKELLKDPPDLVATIGTQASVPTWQILEKTPIPMVFCGVTYPVEGGLIKAFGEATGRNITGIGYAIPARQRLDLLRQMLPDRTAFRRAAFVYSGQVLQDFTYMKTLKALGSVAGWEFVYVDYFDYAQNGPSYRLLLERLREVDPDLVMGWYSLDSLGADDISFRKFVREVGKPVVAITSSMIEQGAIGGILTDDRWLGATQAEMLDAILKGTPAGALAPLEPTRHLMELNLAAAAALGISFDPAVIAAAAHVIR